MGYFDKVASSQFRKTQDGKSLFYLGLLGPLSKPYILETQEQEETLRKKVTSFYKIFISVFIVITIVLFDLLFSGFMNVVLFCVTGTLVWWGSLKLWVAKEIKGLKKDHSEDLPKTFYRDIADNFDSKFISFGFFGSIAFVLIGVLGMLFNADTSKGSPMFVIVFFGICAFISGYIFFLKLMNRKDN